MKEANAIKLYNRLYNKLLYSEWFDSSNLNRELLIGFLKSSDLQSSIKNSVESKDYTPRAVYEMISSLRPIYDCSMLQYEDFIIEAYNFTLNKSYPQIEYKKPSNKITELCFIYLEILREVSLFQRESKQGLIYPMEFLTEDEFNELEIQDEYYRFLKAFQDDYVYEMMLLSRAVNGHNTLDHICGVHFLSMYIARQLKKLGIPVDLGRVSGSAAGHDIGKFGCVGEEIKRVAYLHYYYTDSWFKKHNITYIGHIASNHSTWDLELENLSVESIILIYADFRVKNSKDSSGKDFMHIYDLYDSYKVILDKLDNVDEAKKLRYEKVYGRLKDFEDFMVRIGVKVDIDYSFDPYSVGKLIVSNKYSLMHGEQVISNIKDIAIYHNLSVMHKLRNEKSLSTILEAARSESDSEVLREYLRILADYSIHLTQKQKHTTLKFLYELQSHKEGDIRKTAANISGSMIANFDEKYLKELPKSHNINTSNNASNEALNEYLDKYLHPDHKLIPIQRTWISYGAAELVKSFFSSLRDVHDSYIRTIANFYGESFGLESGIYLLSLIKHIPFSKQAERKDYEHKIIQFLKNALHVGDEVVVISALESVLDSDSNFINDPYVGKVIYDYAIKNLDNESIAINYLLYKASSVLDFDSKLVEGFKAHYFRDAQKTSKLFLSNLKSATHYIVKKVQIDLLIDRIKTSETKSALHTVMHFSNLLKVSAFEIIRNHAGKAIVSLMDNIQLEEKNELAIELLRALEMDDYQYAEYIPIHLGQVLLYLPPHELDEILDDLESKIKTSSSTLTSHLIKTIATIIVSYKNYRFMDSESNEINSKRLNRLLGFLMVGLVSYNKRVRQISFNSLGKDIFSSNLDDSDKLIIFEMIAKKLLTLIADRDEDSLFTISNSVGLNSIYKFIANYRYKFGNINLKSPDKVAFFPGTFDPFSKAHKKICCEIRAMGYEVYIAVDEFSWSKRTLPNELRRNIVKMSLADELKAYIYPNDIPINLSNQEDLKKLRDSFNGYEVNIVIGSDVIINATAYSTHKGPNSIHTFPHIVFERSQISQDSNYANSLERALSKLSGDVKTITLSREYEKVSSTQIRNYVDVNRDISGLVDPLVQKYIYENGFYRREPQFKTLIQLKSIRIDVIEVFDGTTIEQFISFVTSNTNVVRDEFIKAFLNFTQKASARVILVRDASKNDAILALSMHHWTKLSELFNEFNDSWLADYVRVNSIGRIAVIDGFYVKSDSDLTELGQIIFSETMAFCLSKDYEYCIYKPLISDSDVRFEELLINHGFFKASEDKTMPLFVEMSSPCTITFDLRTVLKQPFASSEIISTTVTKTRDRLLKAISKLYPKNLILSINIDILYEALINKICDENQVSTIPSTVKSSIGKAMCVPFGNILSKYVIPNTVTKSLHIEKLFSPDLKSYKMGAFPNYLDLADQVKTLKSFDRPLILVDDILNKGYRANALHPILKEEHISLQKLIVGVMSAKGKEMMDMKGIKVDSVYFVPRLRIWFNESMLYPFVGGDTLWRGFKPNRNIIPSVNLLLPYMSPTFIKGSTNKALYEFSLTCLENSYEILKSIEDEYQSLNERNFTLALMGEVFIVPRAPDKGNDMHYSYNLKPSHYIKNDIELLQRIKNSITEG